MIPKLAHSSTPRPTPQTSDPKRGVGQAAARQPSGEGAAARNATGGQSAPLKLGHVPIDALDGQDLPELYDVRYPGKMFVRVRAALATAFVWLSPHPDQYLVTRSPAFASRGVWPDNFASGMAGNSLGFRV